MSLNDQAACKLVLEAWAPRVVDGEVTVLEFLSFIGRLLFGQAPVGVGEDDAFYAFDTCVEFWDDPEIIGATRAELARGVVDACRQIQVRGGAAVDESDV